MSKKIIAIFMFIGWPFCVCYGMGLLISLFPENHESCILFGTIMFLIVFIPIKLWLEES